MTELLQSEDIGIQIKANLEVFNKIDERFDQLRNKAKQVNELTGNMFKSSQMSGLNRSLTTLNKRLDAAGVSVKGLRGELGDLYSTYDRGKTHVEELSNQQKTLYNSLKSTSKALDSSQKSINRYNKTSTGQVERGFSKTTSAVGRLSKASKDLSTTGSKFISVGQNMALTSTAIGAAMLKGANDAVKLQNQYRVITNLATYGGEKQAEATRNVSKMQAQGAEYSTKYGVAQTKLSAGYEELIRRGYTTNQALATQKTFLQGALASGDDYTDVVHNATAAIEGFGLKSNNTVKMAQNTKMAVNQMAYAADLTATDFQGMGDALRYVAATGRSANQSLSTTTAAIGLLSNNGLEDTVAGTGLRKIMNSFASPNMSEKSQQGQVMSQLGLDKSDFETASGKLKNLASLMDVINDKTSGMKDSARFDVFHKFFGTTGQESALILAKNTNQLRDLNLQVEKSQNMKGGGYIAQLSSKNLMSAQAQLNIFKQALNGLGIAFATTILPNITDAIRGLDKLLYALNDMSPATKKFVATGVLVTAAIAPVSLAIGGLAKAIGFARTAWMLLSGTMGKKLPVTAATSLAQQTEQVSQAVPSSTAPVTGSRVARNAIPTRSLSSHWSNASFIGKATTVAVGADIGLNAVNAFKDGIDTKKGGSELWNAGGKAVGAGVGFYLGGPAGAMIGSTIGDAVTKAIDPDKIVKHMTSNSTATNPGDVTARTKQQQEKQRQKLRSKYYTNSTGNLDVDNANKVLNENGAKQMRGSSTPKKASNAVRSTSDNWAAADNKSAKSVLSSLSGTDQSYIKSAVKLETKANQEWYTSANKTYSSVKKTYGDLYSLAEKYSQKKLSSDKSSYNYLQKQGVLTAAEAQSSYAKEKSGLTTRLTNLKQTINALVTTDKNGGKNRVKEIQRVNRQILSLTDAGTQKQQTLQRQLNRKTSQLTISQYSKVIASSNKAYKATTAAAKKTYNSQVSYADRRYSKEVKAANSLKGISDAQRKSIIAKAQDQRIKTINNAYSQYQGTLKWARKQKNDVIAQAQSQATGVKHALSGAFDSIPGEIGNMLNQLNTVGLSQQPTKQTKNGLTNTIAARNKNGGISPTASKPSQIKIQTGIGKATGGPISKNQVVMVGEKGPELAYNPMTGKFRLLGSNGPTMARVYANERILNAKDTANAMRGGMGAGKTLAGYAAGNATLSATTKTASVKVNTKKVKDPLSDTTKQTKKSMKQISSAMTSGFSKSTKKSNQEITQFGSKSNKSWKTIQSGTKAYTDRIQKNTVGDFDQMQKNSLTQMTQLHKGMNASANATTKDFGTIFAKLGPYAHKGMSLAVTSLNGGISGINSTLSQFGGNKSVLKPIHYAKGSNGALTSDQLAVLNDAGSGPRQEAIIHGDGQFELPNGKNALHYLRKGDRVLNGAQTQTLQQSGVLPHYAKGSGVSDDSLTKLAANNLKSPAAAFDKDFNANVKAPKNGGATQLSNGLTEAGKSGATQVGVPWYKAMWGVIDDAINGGGNGTRGAFLKYAKEHYSGKPYRLGGMGPTYYDCSGMVAAALAHFGVNIGRTTVAMQDGSGTSKIGMSPSKTVPGDLVIWGHSTGGGGHVGIIDRPGASASSTITFNETPPRARDTTVAYHTSLPLSGYFRVNGLKDKDTTKQSANSKLKKLASTELGKSAISKITSQLGVSTDGSFGGTSAKPTGDHAHWLEQAGMPRSWWPYVSAIINGESKWDPHADNPTSSAYGIPQALPGSKMASAGSDWRTNPITQLKWMKSYIKGRYGNAENAWSIRKSRGWYGTGGRPPMDELSHINEHGYELFKPDKPGTIVPHEKSKQIVTGGGKPVKLEPHYEVHVETKGADSDSRILKLIKKALSEHDEELVALVKAQISDDSAYEFLG